MLLFGIAMPKVATFVLGFVPLPDWIPEWTVRLVWIGLAVVIPLAVGLTMAIRRPRGTALSGVTPPAAQEPALTRLLRGFPTTIGIAAACSWSSSRCRSASDALVRGGSSAGSARHRPGQLPSRRVEVAQVLDESPIPRARGEARLVDDLAPILSPSGWPAFRDHIRSAWPTSGANRSRSRSTHGLLLRGSAQHTAWAHGIVVEALTAAPALQTFDPRAQDLERQIRRVWSIYREHPAAHEGSATLTGRLAESAEEPASPTHLRRMADVYRQRYSLAEPRRGVSSGSDVPGREAIDGGMLEDE